MVTDVTLALARKKLCRQEIVYLTDNWFVQNVEDCWGKKWFCLRNQPGNSTITYTMLYAWEEVVKTVRQLEI